MNPIAAYVARRRARREYFAAQSLAADYSRDLYTTTDPAARAELLDRFADMEAAMGRVHRAAFGPAPIDDEGGRDVAEALGHSADLLRAVGSTERAISGDLTELWTIPEPVWRDGTAEEMELWAELARTREHIERARLIERIWPYATERVGGQAAESLSCHEHTELELAAAQAQGRKPEAPKVAMARHRAAVMAAVIVIGVLLVVRLWPHWGA